MPGLIGIDPGIVDHGRRLGVEGADIGNSFAVAIFVRWTLASGAV